MKFNDIVLVNPQQMDPLGFPFGISILANILRRDGFSVSVVDAAPSNLNPSQVVAQIRELKPSIVGLSGLWINFEYIQRISRLLRQENPRIIQLGGGWWSSPVPKVALEETSVDYIVRGEVDHLVSNLCRQLLKGKSIQKEPNVSYLDQEGRFYENKMVPLTPALDQLPLPAYEMFDMNYYVWKTDEKRLSQIPEQFRQFIGRRFNNKREWRWCSLYTGRGCYGFCTFCSAAGQLRRNHSPAYVINHMVKMINDYRVDVFRFNESLTLSTKQWVKEFCREIISRRLNILYCGDCRPDFDYDEETLKLLAESGCYRVLVGFESGDQRILDRMKKRVRVERFHSLIHDLWKHRISVSASFILNMPGECKRSLEATAQFIKTERIHDASVGFASPLPQTELYDYAKDHGFIRNERDLILSNPGRNKGRDDFSAYYERFNFNELPAKTLLKCRRKIERWIVINRFYHRNKPVYWFFHVFPALADIFSIPDYLERVLRFLVEKGPRQFLMKVHKKLCRAYHGLDG